MKRSWLYYISPLVLAALDSVIQLITGLTEMNKHESFGIIEVFVYTISTLLLLGVDYFIKKRTNGKVLYIWIIECILIFLFLVWLVYTGRFRLSGC